MRRDADEARPLAVERLSVRYGRTEAVNEVSLAVEAGQVYALLGRNGAGKTSLMRCLLGHRRPSGGRALLFGEDVWRRRSLLMARVGVVPEQPDAPPAMTAAGLGRFCGRLYGGWDASGYRQRLERFDVPRELPFGRLSKGQKSQVALGLALASRPELLLLDDPTLGLDAVARRSVYDELIDALAAGGTTVFLTTHDLTGVEGLADRVGILRRGRLVLDEELESLRARFRRLRVRAPEESEWLERLRPVAVTARPWGVEAVVAGYDEAVSAGDERSGLVSVEALGLEEIFVALAGEHENGGDA